MILKALVDYYDRLLNDPESDMAPPGFEKKEIPFLIVIREDGSFVGLRDTREGAGKQSRARAFLLPQGEKKASGVRANLLWDSPQYVLGIPKTEKDKDRERAEQALDMFRKRTEGLLASVPEDAGLQAVCAFYEQLHVDSLAADPNWDALLESHANCTFQLEGHQELVAQSDPVRQAIRSARSLSMDPTHVCSITGSYEAPAVLHTAIKGVRDAQSVGANVVSFNLSAFTSFGKSQGLNAPVGQSAAFAYVAVLNRLLSRDSRQRMQIGDATTVFWAARPHSLEQDLFWFLSDPPKGEEAVSYGKIRSLLASVGTGVPPVEDEIPFYVLGLAPNAARLAVRFWYEGNAGELKRRLALHFEDFSMVRAPHDPEFLTLFRLLASLAVASKVSNAPPKLGGDIVHAVFSGTPYPRTLLAAAVQRCKAEQKVTHARAAAIKAVLVRAARQSQSTTQEVTMTLDKQHANIGYVLGRLFAVLERIQESASGGSLNRTIRDTYFGAACSSPRVTFKRLLELTNHHLAKIRNSGKNTTWLEQQLGEVMGHVPATGFPPVLSLDDQGRFAVGYYHQRQEFFQPKQKKEEV